MQRCILLGVCLILLVSLGLVRPSAQAQEIQLCGFTQFADFVIIGATVQDGTRLIIPSSWIQVVPNFYQLLGSGVIIRHPTALHPFIGGFTVVNESDLFQQNPICTVSPAIDVEDEDLPSYAGTAKLLCVAGPSGPFLVTLQLLLTTCDEPDFPSGELVDHPTTTRLDRLRADRRQTLAMAHRLRAGEATNEYRRR